MSNPPTPSKPRPPSLPSSLYDGVSLYADRSFWGITATQFLGAFNDNVFKQVLLLLFVAVPNPNGPDRDLQSLALLVFALPFVLFSGIAGFWSDRNSKQTVIVACKIAELIIMVLGIAAFALHAWLGLSMVVIATLAGILFLMGTQSAFFGPSKYGVLPELFADHKLPAANGVVLMTTFLAIIFGSAFAGFLLGLQGHRLWVVGVACSGVALVGIETARMIRRLPVADPNSKLQLGSLTIPAEIRQLLAADRPMLEATLVSALFWMTAALVQPTVNALGKIQLGESDLRTSLLVTSISIGIAAGSLFAGWLSQNRVDWRLLKVGAVGLVATLLALAPTSGEEHWLGYWGSMTALILLGVFTGLFAVPLQVFMQSRPPRELKGRMIATQNLMNWTGILMSAVIYSLMGKLAEACQWPRSSVFAMTAMLMLPIVIFYRPPKATQR